MRLFVFALAVVLALIGGSGAASAQSLPQPRSAPLLTVEGAIGAANRGDAAVFDRAMLEALGVRTLRTGTTWTTGTPVFEGVLVRDVLAAVGAAGSLVVAQALNDYRIDIPISDFQRYDVLLALRMDGKDLTTRDKGPLWIVYPRDAHTELQNGLLDHRWVWQLVSLRVE